MPEPPFQRARGGGHEQLDDVDLVHMNGRVYDPLIGRFGTPDPTTESPFSTQGWNRYSYVGNSPVNFTDPSGYCFLGCFWQPIFKAIGNFLRQSWGAILQIGATALCLGNPLCGAIVASITSAAVAGLTSGKLGFALKAGLIAFVTTMAFQAAGDMTGAFPGAPYGGHGALDFLSEAHLFNIAAHGAIGCGSAVANGGKCGPGALSGAAGSLAGPLLKDLDLESKLIATSVVGGAASVAGGGKFANGAVTAAFGYLFNEMGNYAQRGYEPTAYSGGVICSAGYGSGCLMEGVQETYIIEKTIGLIYAPFRGVASLLGEWASTSGSFFEGTTYGDKVRQQMNSGDFHSFPASVEGFESAGEVTTITGGDGVTRQMLNIPGGYRGQNGRFEFMKEPDGTISHRFFRPDAK